MAKELPYFKFYLNDWLTGNITIQDMATQGVFVNVCVLFWSRDCDLTYQNCLERFKKKDRKLLENLVKSGIIKIENEKISIVFLEKQLENQNILAEKNKKNIEKRYSTPANATNFSTKIKSVEYNIDKIRGDKIRGDDISIDKNKQHFQDLENSIEIENLAMAFKKPTDFVRSFVPIFKGNCRPEYPNYGEFVFHFKKWFKSEMNKPIIPVLTKTVKELT